MKTLCRVPHTRMQRGYEEAFGEYGGQSGGGEQRQYLYDSPQDYYDASSSFNQRQDDYYTGSLQAGGGGQAYSGEGQVWVLHPLRGAEG